MAPKTDEVHKAKSSLGFKYPALRDNSLRTPDIWLEGKRLDDKLDGLWRIHDNLYDFTQFIKQHPGGSDWLDMTKGTDITEAFEAHHLTSKPENILQKFYVRTASAPRISPFTFKNDGFYRTLKRKVVEELKKVPEGPIHKSKLISDYLLFSFLITALIATISQSLLVGMMSGILLTFLSISAHNFFHQKDNFRMYYFDLTMMSSRGWRISHALSHHLYTNTIYDFEISSMEPLLQFLPHDKNLFYRYASWLYSPLFYSLIYIGFYIKTICQALRDKKPLHNEDYLSVLLFLYLYVFGGQPFLVTLKMFFFIQLFSSLWFGIIGINGAHHHPDVFHDGDAARPQEELDWGIHQLDTVMDRTESTGNHFWALVTFGDHALHHLFPTLDHGTSNALYPTFEKTCKEFGIKLKMNNSINLACGQFRSLARIEPNKDPPRNYIVKKKNC